jgi:hypothetical protein
MPEGVLRFGRRRARRSDLGPVYDAAATRGGKLAVRILTNHLGYEPNGPKRFVCRCDENLGPTGRFGVIDGSGRELLEGVAGRIEPMGSAGPWHYAGDFSTFREAGGDFRIRFEAGNQVATSERFGLGAKIVWRLAKPLVVQFLRGARAVRANFRGESWTAPGMLEGDERFFDVGGGWFDRSSRGGTALHSGARVLLGLVGARLADPRDPQIDDELRHGAAWLRRLMPKYPSSGSVVARAHENGRLELLRGDESSCGVALVAGYLYAKISEALGDVDLLRRGQRFWKKYRDLGGTRARGARLLSAAALHVATLEPGYLAAAERTADELILELNERADAAVGEFPESDAYAVAALSEFAASDPQNPMTPRVKLALGKYLDSRVAAARGDAFGLTPLPQGVAPDDVPTCRSEQAWASLCAHRVTGRSAYVALAANALNWLLGLNTADSSLVVGTGVCREACGESRPNDGAVVPPGSVREVGVGGAGAFLMAISLTCERTGPYRR